LAAQEAVDQNQGEFSQDGTEERFKTPTSGGKANAVDLLSKQVGEGVWIVLIDDDDAVFGEDGPGNGAVRVLEFNGWGTGGVKEVAEWPKDQGELDIKGASRAIWLDRQQSSTGLGPNNRGADPGASTLVEKPNRFERGLSN
jgi:hypothetical protein